MKILIIALIALFAASMLAMPYEGSGEVPLATAAVVILAVYFIYRLLRGPFFALRMKLALKKRGFKVRAARGIFGSGYITAEDRYDRYLIRFLLRKKKHCTLHFENETLVHYFKTTVKIMRGASGLNANYAAPETRQVGTVQLPTPKGFTPTKSFVVVDRRNSTTTDARNKMSLSNGDAICGGEVKLYSYKKFLEAIDRA